MNGARVIEVVAGPLTIAVMDVVKGMNALGGPSRSEIRCALFIKRRILTAWRQSR